MNMHKNARMTPFGRERLVQAVLSGQTPEAAARAAGVCPRTVRKWVARFNAEGRAGLMDRSSRPKRVYRPTPARSFNKSKSCADNVLRANRLLPTWACHQRLSAASCGVWD